ncbi:MAG: hypothetical protein E7599_04170 [Ruminococcaceae bacterium]|nr:hypothetical protein [Oscillospiraceae bacterium]
MSRVFPQLTGLENEPDKPVDPDKPVEPDKPTEPVEPDGSDKPSDDKPVDDQPINEGNADDGISIGLIIGIAVAAVIAAGAVFFVLKKKKA